MRSDLYTKLVLTIIAACLGWICYRDYSRYGSNNVAQAVEIVGVRIPLPYLYGVNQFSETLPVKIMQ